MKSTKNNKNKIIKSLTALLIIMILSICVCGCGKKTESQALKCSMLVECSNAVKNDDLRQDLKDFLPKDGTILKETEIDFKNGESVYDILERTMKEEGVLMEASFTGDIAYIEGIDNLYEFECGDLSGWMYCVNGEYPNIGCSGYKVKAGDKIEWHYTCDLGKDLGQEYSEK